ncbi:MAG: response regulator [Candidatus Poseidoniales archaeon]|nr:MAG: response regulator [Candidatus Poseidoniales archaeon]
MRVLAFEDHYDIEAILTAGGVNMDNLIFEQRWNSTDALEHIRDFAPEVLLLDHYMPPLNGFQVLEMLLSSDIKRPLTVIAMSSAADKNDDMVGLGADRGVVKFDLAELDVWPKQTSREGKTA